MSIDISVFPTEWNGLTVDALEQCIRDLSVCRPELEIGDNDVLIEALPQGDCTIQMDGLYIVPFGCRALSCFMIESEENEFDYLSSSVHNISKSDLRSLATKQEKLGFYFYIVSRMGRGHKESSMMLLLAASLAKLTSGLVVMEDHSVENVPRGSYWWNEIMDKMAVYDGNPIDPVIRGSLTIECPPHYKREG